MYLLIDKGEVMDADEITGIFDLDITSQSYITREYLNSSEKRGRVVTTAEDIPKTFMVCGEEEDERVYLVQPATSTLIKRMEGKN